jgi:16S rRNA (guanine527-N7)-methyltransferase
LENRSLYCGICQNIPHHLQFLLMLSRNGVRALLEPFEVRLSDDSIDKLVVYLDLLLRWNRKINLTAIRTPEECVTRHFGESIFLSRLTRLRGRLLDVGSGAGFPGLAVKLIAADLEVVLLEPVAKKRAFLKEVSRVCELTGVDVLGRRLEEYCRGEQRPELDIITLRAVGGLESLVPIARGLLKRDGHLCLYIGSPQAHAIRAGNPDLIWQVPAEIPLSHDRQILQGIREC